MHAGSDGSKMARNESMGQGLLPLFAADVRAKMEPEEILRSAIEVCPFGIVIVDPLGKIVLAENLYYSGNTVVIDHGFGIYTLYAHLSEIGVHAGDPVEVSAEIGKVGATGRVTGPHLHWGLSIDHARVNGLQIVQRQP